MQFKEVNLENEFKQSPILLQIIANDFSDYCLDHFNIVVMCTRIKEIVHGSSGVHEAGRAIDFRDEHPTGNFRFSDEQESEVCRYINQKYERNDGLPTIIFHSFCEGPKHVHLQIAESNMVYCKKES